MVEMPSEEVVVNVAKRAILIRKVSWRSHPPAAVHNHTGHGPVELQVAPTREAVQHLGLPRRAQRPTDTDGVAGLVV